MPENDIKVTRTGGGLGRPQSGEDHYSAMIFYTAGSLPSGFSSSDRIKKIFSVDEAEDLGIVDTHADETKGTGGQVVIGGTWVADEVCSITIGGAVLGTHTAVSGSVATTDIASALVTNINAGTSTGLRHGWVATLNSSTVELAQPAKLGVTNNAGGIAFTTDSASGTGTPTQFTSGVGSYFAIMHYHISEYFRMHPTGVLWVAIYAQGTYDGTEIKTVTDFAEGKIRQSAVYVSHESFASSQLTASQTVLDTVATEHAPQNIVFHSDMTSSTLATLPNLTTLSNERVSMMIGEDGDWHQSAYSNTASYLQGSKVTFQGAAYVAKTATTGNAPWDGTKWTFISYNLNTINGFTIGTTGVALGVISASTVNQSISEVGAFNLVTGTGLSEPAFATGDLYQNQTTALKDQLQDYHYTYIRNHRGQDGTYFNDSRTAITESNDFSTIENNRTTDKVQRGIRSNNLPNLSRRLYLNTSTGTLSEDTIQVFKSATVEVLLQMQADGEISGSETNKGFEVSINPEQKVLETSEIKIGVKYVPTGIARNISFTIGLAPKIG